MTFGQLRTFLEVARNGSVRGAARALVVTEPSVSAAVSSLQRELGVSLVERHGRGIRLTAAGAELERYAAQILGLADRAGRAVREAAGEPGHLRLAAVTSAAEFVLPAYLKRFLRAHPDVDVSLDVGNRAWLLSRLVSHEADLGFGGRPPAGAGIDGRPFAANPLVIVATPEHPRAGGRSFDPSALGSETWLVREPGSGTRQATEEFWAEHDLSPSSVMTLGSNGAVVQAAALGLGIALLSERSVSGELRSGTVERLRVRGTPVRRSWFVQYVEADGLPRTARALLAILGAERR